MLSTSPIPTRVALCDEIIDSDLYGDKFYGMHYWTVQLPGKKRMQTVICAVCGNYQQVDTFHLQAAIEASPISIVCRDQHHISRTIQIIASENEQKRLLDLQKRLLYLEYEMRDSDTDSMSDQDDELGPPPPLPPSLVRTDIYVPNDQLQDWLPNENHRDLPRQ